MVAAVDVQQDLFSAMEEKKKGWKLDGRTYTPWATPCCVVDEAKARRNAENMLARVEKLGMFFRPHVKTHKTIEGALLQTGGRKSGIVVSTLAEIRFYIDAGFDDIVYGVPLAPNRFEDVYSLIESGKDIKIVMDSSHQLKNLESWTMTNYPNPGKKWQILLMLGATPGSAATCKEMHQVGLDPALDSSYEFAKAVHDSQSCAYTGVYIHLAGSYGSRSEEECKKAAAHERDIAGDFAKTLKQKYGIISKDIGCGSTPSCSHPADTLYQGVITELHAGNYLVYDWMQCLIGSCKPEEIALFVKIQVISIYEDRNLILIDMGWTGASQQGSHENFGEILSHPELKIKSLKQETGEVTSKNGEKLDFSKYPVGTILTLAPYHSCAAAHQYSSIFIERDRKIVGEWKRCESK